MVKRIKLPTPTHIYRKDDTASWLKNRAEDVTASNLASLFGHGYNSCNAYKKSFGEEYKELTGPDIMRGKILEPACLMAAEMFIGLKQVPMTHGETWYYRHPDIRIGATPDFFALHDDELILIECKAPKARSFERWLEKAPLYYVIQMQAQMMCTGLTKGILVALTIENDHAKFCSYLVSLNEEFCAMVETEVEKFWREIDTPSRTSSELKARVEEVLSKSITPFVLNS